MATTIKRIEKEFVLKVLYDEQIPITYLRDRTEYILTLNQPAKTEMIFISDKPISKLKPRAKLELLFDYRGQVVNFSAEVASIKDGNIHCITPDVFYKNLDRSFSRVAAPPDFKIQFTFLGDRYNLSFPKVTEFETETAGEFFKNIDPRNISGVIDQMSSWIKQYACGHKMVIFKDNKPSTTEERIISETGKTLFLPSTLGYFPITDPYPRKRIITEEMFKRYLESTGVSNAFLHDACARFVKTKYDEGFFSEAWIPILFQEYVIGYIHVWINKEGIPPVDFRIIDTMYEFAKMLAHSLKMNGYFEKGRLANEPFSGKIIDISASGLAFISPPSLVSALLVDSELIVNIITQNRSINASAKIVRRIKDDSTVYFGCRFLDMAPEDLRFLFESIYGKKFTDADAMFLSGQV
ncbi:MAG: PilZ domain-containing protein [Treponema sp.]|nr:PilZ domain-containing protein [Treponema sp.]